MNNPIEVFEMEESWQAIDTKSHLNPIVGSQGLVAEFISALTEEIEAIKAGRGGSMVRVFDGKFVREEAGIFVYCFMVENFIVAIDDAPLEVEIGDARCRGHIIQTKGLEVIIGVDCDLGPTIPDARLFINLYFLHELLKKRFEQVRERKISADFRLAELVFGGGVAAPSRSATLPSLEPHPKQMPNGDQLKAAKMSQVLPLTLIWGPPGTGKTQTLARIVECFIKRDHRVLVVSHANAAVDEVTEDIAEILENTDYYKRGQIVRLGNCQKESIETEYQYVLLEKIVERLGTSLRGEKDQLYQLKEELEEHLAQLASVEEVIHERNTISRQKDSLIEVTARIENEIVSTKARLAQRGNDLKDLKSKLQRAQSSGAVKRFFLRLNPAKIQKEIDQVKEQLDEMWHLLRRQESELQKAEQEKLDLESRLGSAKERIATLLRRIKISEPEVFLRQLELNERKDDVSTRIRKIEEELSQLRGRVLAGAKVICTTLTKTFSDRAFPETPFDVLILDEASMAPMPHLYWALGRCRTVAVIAGDFLQLPPICIAKTGMAQKWLARSIYQQLGIDTVEKAEGDDRVCLLKTQYRMNPGISCIPNQFFYKGRLCDDKRTHNHVAQDELSKSPLTVIDTTAASPWCSRLEGRSSRFNLYHALLAATTAKRILQTATYSRGGVGIITPYTIQSKLIGKMLKDMGLERQVPVATIHRFQGGEAQVIIFDLVEGPGVRIAPMLDDSRDDSGAPLLLNVAMTRAKCKIFLLANLQYLKRELLPGSILYRLIGAFEQNGERIDSGYLIDSYFTRDFDRWVEKLVLSSRWATVEPSDVSLFTEKTFYAAFFEDLRRAREEVIILSPYLSTQRSSQFASPFQMLISKGVKIRLFTREGKDQVIKKMRAIGVEVTERRRMHQKIAIIDRSIAWEGSLNILGHRDSNEQMRRLPFVTAVNELIRLCGLEATSANGGPRKTPVLTLEQCIDCGAEMIVKVGKYGPFLSCVKRSCSSHRSIQKRDRVRTQTPCPGCGRSLIVRKGPKGFFLGCSGYPNCKKTMSLR